MRTILVLCRVVVCAGITLAALMPSLVLAGTPAKVVIGLNSDVRNFDPVNTLDTTTDGSSPTSTNTCSSVTWK